MGKATEKAKAVLGAAGDKAVGLADKTKDAFGRMADKAEEKVRETVGGASGAEIKAAMLDRAGGLKEGIKNKVIGSGSIKTELGRVKDAYVSVPGDVLGAGLKTAGRIVTLHPLDAVKEAVIGGGKLVGTMAEILTAPGRGIVAGAKGTWEALKAAVESPFKAAGFIAESPFRLFGVVKRGANKLYDLPGKVTDWGGKKISGATSGAKSVSSGGGAQMPGTG